MTKRRNLPAPTDAQVGLGNISWTHHITAQDCTKPRIMREASEKTANFCPRGYVTLTQAPETRNSRLRLAQNGKHKALVHLPKLTGDRNQCPTCGACFNSTYAFDAHRTGSFEPDNRRCLSVAEMQQRGFAQRGAFWYSPVSAAKREHLAVFRRKS